MIRREDVGPLTLLTLDRPDKANALTRAMMGQLVAELKDAGTRQQAVILTGAGTVFSAGADLDEARAGLATDGIWEELSGTLAALPCLTIAALNGTLAGGAFGMALACDIRLGVPGAKFFYPVMKLGFLPQPSDSARMAALIGPGRARMILMGGAKIEATEALNWGLIDRLSAPETLLEDARTLTADACAAPAGHAGRIKALIPRDWSH
ncbi:enoyl-CoA hydratase/isomerase family protein [Pararhodobacter zhoushanensis]|uniref:Enoyl-CoA hydratase/isomerase family protein n=1 Tax=Pararhodobacter zhoushanensis TaxID=2479545 RepID=A0ABT3GVH2_9RHOB|nr:enoyl-CoA hydratase/isomerase family protein [Pararhodobacter zhoushanensis]MCW1931523.1 enoyl-CoA hydratase/isomerase family protein [Pararhodobacter zhoushanensis]